MHGVVIDCEYGSWSFVFFFFQAEDGIRDLVRSRGLGDVYKRQAPLRARTGPRSRSLPVPSARGSSASHRPIHVPRGCLLYTSDAADERSSVDLGGRRIIKKKNIDHHIHGDIMYQKKRDEEHRPMTH